VVPGGGRRDGAALGFPVEAHANRTANAPEEGTQTGRTGVASRHETFPQVVDRARWIVRPVDILVNQARRIGSGDLSPRASLRGHDEISDLAREMNQMADQLQDSRLRLVNESNARISALDQLRHADRLATVGTLASGIAHELGTPLNVVTARARLIETGAVGAEEIADNARIIHEQGERMTRIIRQLLDFSRKGGTRQLNTVDLRDSVREALTLLGPYAEKRKIALQIDEGRCEAAWSRIEGEPIKQVLANLVMN